MIRYSGGQLPNAFIIHHDPLSVPGKAAMHRQNPALHKPDNVRVMCAAGILWRKGFHGILKNAVWNPDHYVDLRIFICGNTGIWNL